MGQLVTGALGAFGGLGDRALMEDLQRLGSEELDLLGGSAHAV
jgi:hypothetical protein